MNETQLSKKLEKIEEQLNAALKEIHDAVDCALETEKRIRLLEIYADNKKSKSIYNLTFAIVIILFLLGFATGLLC